MRKIFLTSSILITLITSLNAFENIQTIQVSDSDLFFYGAIEHSNSVNLNYPKLVDKNRYVLSSSFNREKKQFVQTYMYDYRDLSKFNKSEEQLLKEEPIFLKSLFCSIDNKDTKTSKIKNIYIFKDKKPFIKEYEFFKDRDCLK